MYLMYFVQAGDVSFPLDCKKRSSTPDVLKSRTRVSSEMSVQDGEDDSEETINQQSDHSPVVSHRFIFLVI